MDEVFNYVIKDKSDAKFPSNRKIYLETTLEHIMYQNPYRSFWISFLNALVVDEPSNIPVKDEYIGE